MKKALVKIIDRHKNEGEDSSFELTTSGTYEDAEDGFYLTYDEADEELEGSLTRLFVSRQGKIQMSRTGKYNTEMVFEPQQRHSCFYSTPFGELMMGIYTKSIAFEPRENGGRLRFAYTIDFNNDLASENELDISFILKEDE